MKQQKRERDKLALLQKDIHKVFSYFLVYSTLQYKLDFIPMPVGRSNELICVCVPPEQSRRPGSSVPDGLRMTEDSPVAFSSKLLSCPLTPFSLRQHHM